MRPRGGRALWPRCELPQRRRHPRAVDCRSYLLRDRMCWSCVRRAMQWGGAKGESRMNAWRSTVDASRNVDASESRLWRAVFCCCHPAPAGTAAVRPGAPAMTSGGNRDGQPAGQRPFCPCTISSELSASVLLPLQSHVFLDPIPSASAGSDNLRRDDRHVYIQ
jgi:hypothetical protein